MIITTHNHLGDHVCLTAVAHNLYEVTGQKTQILKNQYSSIYQNKRMMKILEKCSSDTFTKIASSYERGVSEGVMAFSDKLDI